MENKNVLLGVLGGLGPLSTVYFCEMLNRHTKAACDNDHIDMIISSRASTPDRTAYILGKSTRDPLPVMIEEAQRLERAGAELIVIPCNTAHYFYDGLTEHCRVPILNIIGETVDHLAQGGIRRFGLLATEGTVQSGAYHRLCAEKGLECITPTEEDQRTVTSVIYDYVKQNKPVDRALLLRVADRLLERGCERIVLGCTELSILKASGLDDNVFTDSLEVLAYRTILSCNKEPIGFPDAFSGR